jgi:hypothetical protein
MKLRITEGQLERIKSQITEQGGNRYNREVNVTFNPYRATYKGNEINDVSPTRVRLSYDIEIEGRSWGVKGVSLSGIIGPTELEAEVEYFVDNDNTDTVTLPMKLNWGMIVTEEEKGMGVITVGDDVEIELVNDSEGNLMVKEIKVTVYTL